MRLFFLSDLVEVVLEVEFDVTLAMVVIVDMLKAVATNGGEIHK